MRFLIYIIHERWEDALYWINYILTQNAKQHRLTLLNAQLWQLIIHVELQNYQLLENLLRNTVRAWKQEGFFVPYLQNLVKCLQRQINQSYPQFWEEVADLALENAKLSNYQGVDTLSAFAQSRLEGHNFNEYRRELWEKYVQKKASVEFEAEA